MDYQEYVGLKKNAIHSNIDIWKEDLDRLGYFLVPNVLDQNTIIKLQEAVDKAWNKQLKKYGEPLLRSIGDYGVARGLMEEDPIFFDLLTLPFVDKVLDFTVGPTSILHLQNGICLYPQEKHNQGRFHKDFAKDFISDKLLSINFFFILDPFNQQTGGTWIIPGTHRNTTMPSESFIEKNKIQVTAQPGSILIFDSLLWHCSGENSTNNVRRAINHQYTRPFIKQQLNYPEMFKGKVDMESKLAQRLGLWSISPRNVDEYRVSSPELRTYRAGQG